MVPRKVVGVELRSRGISFPVALLRSPKSVRGDPVRLNGNGT